MAYPALQAGAEFKEMNCGECGITFFVPHNFYNERKKDHSIEWFCPNGHGRVFSGETEAEKFKRLYEDEKRIRASEASARFKAEKNMRKLQKRIRNGVCPQCHRSFVNLKRHIACKHPLDDGGNGLE